MSLQANTASGMFLQIVFCLSSNRFSSEIVKKNQLLIHRYSRLFQSVFITANGRDKDCNLSAPYRTILRQPSPSRCVVRESSIVYSSPSIILQDNDRYLSKKTSGLLLFEKTRSEKITVFNVAETIIPQHGRHISIHKARVPLHRSFDGIPSNYTCIH